jgi:hypothetical protein
MSARTTVVTALARAEGGAATVPDSQYQGVMLVNPRWTGSLRPHPLHPRPLRAGGASDAYDWIGFDPRGVGSSEGALSCRPNYFGYDRPNYVPTTPLLERTWLDRSEGYANACARRNDAGLLSNLTTVD